MIDDKYIDFTLDEINKLESFNFKRILDTNEFRNTLYNGDYQTALKLPDKWGAFEYYYDVNEGANDIDRANGNKTEIELEWDELIELLKKEGFKE